jgi:hypothetical protein
VSQLFSLGGFTPRVKMESKEKLTERMEDIKRMTALHAQMREVDRREVASKSDIDLTIWQTSFPLDSPQFRLAEYEWQRRLSADQIKAARWAAVIGLAGVIVGALLTKVLEKF